MAVYEDPYADKVDNNGANWWKLDKKDIHKSVVAYINHLDQDQSYRSHENLTYMKLYGNYELSGLDAFSYARTESNVNIQHRVTLNIVRSMIDTVISKMAKNKPKPTFLTDGGDWGLQQKAKKLTKYCEGIFNSCEYYDKAVKALKDACIFGTGAIKFYTKDGKICCERVFPEELKTDDLEAFYSNPRQIHQIKHIHKSVLKEMFPGEEFYIESTNNSTDPSLNSNNHTDRDDLIQVIESWHLPSGEVMDEDGNEIEHDGVHSISISNRTLFSEPYNKKYFPFVFFRWSERPLGFWGTGISEELKGLQLEINKILRTIQVSMHLVSIPKLMVEASSKVVTAHLNNKIGGIIKYAGTAPQYQALGGVPPELFTHLDRLYNRAYEIVGVSALSARSEKPGGIESGKALREFNDIESERFLEVGQRYEKTFIDAAEIIIDMSKDLYKDNESLKSTFKGKKFIETIEWKEVDMKEDQFMMDIFPTSALANTPSGRLKDVEELLAAGFITKEDGLKLLDFPDLESTTSLLNAGTEDIERMIELMIDKGRYQTPEPYQNLEMGIKKCQQAYLKYRAQNAPDSRLELLRRWMEDAQGLLQKAIDGTTPPPPLPQTAIPQTNTPIQNRGQVLADAELEEQQIQNQILEQQLPVQE